MRKSGAALNIEQCIKTLLEKASLAEMVSEVTSLRVGDTPAEEIKMVLETLSDHYKSNRHREAVATLLALLITGGDKVLSKMRRTSMFRASTYKYKIGALQKSVEACLSAASVLNLSSEKVRYLNSVRSLLTVAPQANRLRESLIMRLRARKIYAIKTLFVYVNQLFSQNWESSQYEDSDTIKHWSSEDLASAFSYLLILFKGEFGFDNAMWNRTDENCGRPLESVYVALLVDAAKITLLLDAEILIDGLPYEALTTGSAVVVRSIEPAFEKSVRLGYIQSDLQVAIRALHLVRQARENAGPPLIRDFLQQAIDAGLVDLAVIKEKPLPRIVLMLPDVNRFYSPFSTDYLYLEEVALLYEAGVESFQIEAGPNLPISGSLTSIDVLKVQRFFRLVDAMYRGKLSEVQDDIKRAELTVRSTIPVIKREHLVQVLERIVPRDKVESILEMVTMTGSEKHVDIQYKPLIAVADSLIVAPAIFSKSNLIRNIVVGNKLRTAATTLVDPMQNAVVEALTQANFLVRANFTFNISGARETDILCIRDGYIFVFECKNSYHPCSPHELRTSYEHLKTAEKQLSIRKAWLRKEDNQKKLLKWLGWDVSPTASVHTGIITANRLFNGFSMDGHPVRQAHELINVLLRGEVRSTDDDTRIRFWRDELFHSHDLIDYLSGKAIIEVQNENLQPFSRIVRIGDAALEFSTYIMETQKAAEAMREAFNTNRLSE